MVTSNFSFFCSVSKNCKHLKLFKLGCVCVNPLIARMKLIFIPPQNECFWGYTGISLSLRVCTKYKLLSRRWCRYQVIFNYSCIFFLHPGYSALKDVLNKDNFLSSYAGKGEAASIQHILLLNPLQDANILDWSILKQIADNILKCI